MDIKRIHEWFPALDITWFPGYQNGLYWKFMRNMPQSEGDPSTTIDHIKKLIKHYSMVNVVHLDSLMELFIIFIEYMH